MWLFNFESLQEVLSKNSCFARIIDSTSLVFFQMKFSIRTEKRHKPNECDLERDYFKVLKKYRFVSNHHPEKVSLRQAQQEQKAATDAAKTGRGEWAKLFKERHWTQNSICMIQKTQICRTSMTSKICVSLKGLRWWIEQTWLAGFYKKPTDLVCFQQTFHL